MPATVVTPANLTELATTGRVTPDKDLPPTTREVIALKKAGKEPPKTEFKAELPKETPKAETAPADDSKKLDDSGKPAVKDTRAEPSASKPKTEPSEDDLPERARKVIGNKHRQMKEAEEFAELQRRLRLDAEKRVKDLEAELAGKAKPKEDPKPSRAEGDKPKPEDYPNVAEYTDALTDWKLDQRDKQRTQKQADDAETSRQTKAAQSWQKRLDAYREEYPEFDDLIAGSPLAKQELPNRVIGAIQESDVGPQLLRHLAETPADWAALRELNADKAIKFLGRLEAKLEAPKEKDPDPTEVKKDPPKDEPKPDPAKNVSKAPPPTDTSVGSGEPIEKDPSKMSTQEYLAWKRAQRRAASAR